MSAPLDLSVIIPAYNEGHRLPGTLPRAAAYLEGQARTFELLLVDDGSTDSTLKVMQDFAGERPYVKVLTREQNRGKGRSLAEGVAVSTGNLVLLSDADLSTPLDELQKLEAALQAGSDIAIASRSRRGSRVEVSQPFYRVWMGKVFNLMVQILLLPGIWDTQCGFKLFRGDVAREIFQRLQTDGFAYDVEVLYRARRQGCRIAEVPVRWLNSPSSRVAPVRDSAGMFADLLRIRFRKR